MGKPLREQTVPRVTPPCRCSNCHDSGIVFLVQRDIVGYTDLMENSMPCILCAAVEELKPEYEIFRAEQAAKKPVTSAAAPAR